MNVTAPKNVVAVVHIYEDGQDDATMTMMTKDPASIQALAALMGDEVAMHATEQTPETWEPSTQQFQHRAAVPGVPYPIEGDPYGPGAQISPNPLEAQA